MIGEPMEETEKLFDAIVHGQADEAKQLVEKVISLGLDAERILDQYLIPAMEEVGLRFERNEYYIPDLLISAQAMKFAMEVLKPQMTGRGLKPVGRVALGTVRGDLHDIGKNLVGSMLEGNGFEVVNCGVDVHQEEFVRVVREEKINILGLSALLTTTMVNMQSVIEELERAGLRDSVKVIIGGAPVTQGFAEKIGADGYSDNANGAVTLAKQLILGY
jgi:corrinoid protein of di/trimethylamine methyltransferase